ncbi:MAG: hypothetical protein GY842_18670 [bacterium]|nr:hypothetical protein [bacterium]
MPLGGAVLTSAGRLKYKAIVHVAGINLLWFATEKSIRASVRSAWDARDGGQSTFAGRKARMVVHPTGTVAVPELPTEGAGGSADGNLGRITWKGLRLSRP